MTIIRGDDAKFPALSTLASTASVELTSDDDKILLFKDKDWLGDVLYLKGKKTISNLNDEDDGGKKGFANSVSSVRKTPFTIKVKYHVIMDSAGTLPYGNTTKPKLESVIMKAHVLAAIIWEDSLIKLERDDIVYWTNDALLEADCSYEKLADEYPNLNRQLAHCFVVENVTGEKEKLGKANILGCSQKRAVTPGFYLEAGSSRSISELARTIAHELGHSLGLEHGSNSDKNMLMTQAGKASPILGTDIGRVRSEKVHIGLADKKEDDKNYRRE